MKVAYVTSYDSRDVRYFSGLGYYIAQSLERQGIELIRIDCSVKFSPLQRIRRGVTKLFHRRIRQIERETAYLKRVAASIRHQLSGQEYDLIFSPGSLPVSYLQTMKPVVFLTDATYDCMTLQYNGRKPLCFASLLQGNKAEARAIRNASMIFYTSEWAIQNAINVYKADPDKIKQVGFGPNLPVNIPVGGIERMLHHRQQRRTKTILFIGVDWYRKGAGIAIEVVRQLNASGIEAHINIVGCRVPEGMPLPSFVTHYPFVSKSSQHGIAFLQRLFEEADYFMLPTQSDYTPIVFSEAAAYGLPVITTNVGGCRSVVINGVTGFCFPRESFVEEAVQKIHWFCRYPDVYGSFSREAFYHYKRTLNWDVTGKKMVTALGQLISNSPSPGLPVV